MKKNNYFFFLALTLFSCNFNNKKGEIEYNLQNIKISDISEVVNSSDIIDSIQYIKLEDTDEPIGEIKKLIVRDNKIILWDNSRKSVWIYGINGKLLGRINKLGKGRGEYGSIYNIAFSSPDKVDIIDGTTQSIKTYSITGKFLESEKTRGYSSDCFNFQNLNCTFYYSFLNPGNAQLYHLNVKGNENENGYFAYLKPYLFNGDGNVFCTDNDSVFFHMSFKDTIYCITNKKLVARYTFDFGNKRYPYEDIYKAKNIAQYEKIIEKAEYEGNISNLSISKDYLVCNFYRQETKNILITFTIIYNRKTQKIKAFRYLLKGEHEIMLGYPMASDSNYFYLIQNAVELPDKVLNKLTKNKNLINENSNPVIIRYKYKF